MKNFKKLILTLVSCSFAIYSVTAQDTQQITGGEEIEISISPFQISLQLNGGAWCGGSILNESWVITAAHCVNGINVGDLDVAVGITEQNEVGTSGQLIDVQEIFIHPDYDPQTSDNDIALLLLSNEINYNDRVQPIRIINLENQNLNDAGQIAYASGWGWTNPGTTSPSNHLQGVEIPIITNQNADAQLDISFFGHPELTNNMIATGFNTTTERLGPCHGDSGGPLTVSDGDDVIYLVGLVSWGVPSCVGGTNSPSVYTNVINYEDWIYGLICQDDVFIDDVIHSDVLIEASTALDVSNSVNDNLIVDFRAGERIVFSVGFSYSAISDGMLRASIGGNCENPGTSNFVSSVGTGTGNNFFSEVESELNIYPNPTSDFVTIKFDQGIEEISSFVIFNLNGSEILSEAQRGSNGEMKIDISTLPSGLYTYVFDSGGLIRKGKIIKN